LHDEDHFTAGLLPRRQAAEQVIFGSVAHARGRADHPANVVR